MALDTFTGGAGALSTGTYDSVAGSMPRLNGSGGLIPTSYGETEIAAHKTATSTLAQRVRMRLAAVGSNTFYPLVMARRSGTGGSLSGLSLSVGRGDTTAYLSRYSGGSSTDFDWFTISVPANADDWEIETDGNATNPVVKARRNGVQVRSVTYTGTVSGTGSGVGFYLNDVGGILDEFEAADVSSGAVTIVVPLLTNSSTLYAPTAVGGALTIVAPLFTNTSTLYAPTVAIGGVALSPPLLTNSPTLYAPTVTVAAASLAVPLVSSTLEMFAPSVATGSLSLDVPLLTNVSTLYAPAVVETGVPGTVEPPLLDSTATLYSPTVLAAANAVAAPLLANVAILYAPTVGHGVVAIIVPLLPSGALLFAPTAWTQGAVVTHLTGTLTVRPLLTGSLSVGPVLTGTLTIEPTP